MLILLRTQVERTAKAPIPACHARVGGLCGFQDTVERVPHRKPEDRTLRRRVGALRKWQTQKKNASGRISAEGEAASGEAAKQDKAAGSCAPRGGHICPRCGQFRGFTRAFQTQRKTAGGRCGMKKARRFKGNRGIPTKNTR